MRLWVQVLETTSLETHGNAAYIRLKVVTPFPRLCASGSYVYRAALLSLSDVYVYFSRHDDEVGRLVKEVMDNDLVLRAIVGGAEMLILPSDLLPEHYQSMCSLYPSCNNTLLTTIDSYVFFQDHASHISY
jgi:hypothetical protein